MKYMLNDEKMFMDIADGTAVIINSETGIYYGINSFGTQVFEALTFGMDTDDVITELKKLKNAPSDMDCRFDVFLADLLKYELLIPGVERKKFVLNENVAQKDEFTLEVIAYEDAQEMLLADPIHEVKETMGWTPEKDSIGYSKEETREREKKVK